MMNMQGLIGSAGGTDSYQCRARLLRIAVSCIKHFVRSVDDLEQQTKRS